MVSRVSFSERDKHLERIWSWYEDQRSALRMYRDGVITTAVPLQDKFRALTTEEVKDYFDEAEGEIEVLFSFDIISATEALLRRDFYSKVYDKAKSDVAREFRNIHKRKGDKISLENDIIETWKRLELEQKKHFSELIGLLKYRHWLAHGRYWNPRLGTQYDVAVSYDIARRIFDFIESQNN